MPGYCFFDFLHFLIDFLNFEKSFNTDCTAWTSLLPILFFFSISYKSLLISAKVKSYKTTYFDWFLVIIIILFLSGINSEFKQEGFGILTADSTADHRIKTKWTPPAASN